MKKNRLFMMGTLAVLLAFGLVLAGCGGGKKGGGSSGGGSASVPKASGKASPATDFRYDLNKAGDGVVITGYVGKGGDIVIPAEIEGLPVVEFRGGGLGGGFADSEVYFKYLLKNDEAGKQAAIKSGEVRKPITSIVFPDSMTIFSAPSSMDTYENDGAFESCTELKSVVLPKKMDVIPGMFSNNLPKLTSIKMPESVEKIGPRAFAGCSALKSITIPDGVKIIDQAAFSNCKSLTSIKIPDSLEKIGWAAFLDCSELATVEINPHPIKYYAGATEKWNYAAPRIDADNGAFERTKINLATRKIIQDTGYKGGF
jgi:hypothetical protein